jgi:hypothetical protein
MGLFSRKPTRFIVKVMFRSLTAPLPQARPGGGYAYTWTLNRPPAVGDRVVVPGIEGPASAVVVAMGTREDEVRHGPLKAVIRIATAADFTEESRREAASAEVVPPTRGTIQCWGALTELLEVDGERSHRAGVRAALANSGVIPTEDGVEVDDIPTVLVPRPGLPPAVVCAGSVVGRLTAVDATPYRSAFEHLAAQGLALAVTARIWAREGSDLRSRVSVRVPEPDEIWPPMPLPTGRFAVIPAKSKFEVTGEEAHLDRLTRLLKGRPRANAIATLHGVDVARTRSTVRMVEVRIQGETVGTLSKTASEALLPLVDAMERAGILPVARASISGNQLKADVAVRVTKASELPAGWVTQNIGAAAADNSARTAG